MSFKKDQNLNDKELVKGCIQGNSLMQQTLFEQYKRALYTLAYRLLNNHETSNDVLQDAFLEIFGSLGKFQFKSSLYTWMRTIVIRQTITKLRENDKFQIVSDEIPECINNSDLDFTAQHLEKAIEMLPKSTRAVFILIEIEGYKHKEVAEQLNISEGTSKSQLNYAKKLLRELLIPVKK